MAEEAIEIVEDEVLDTVNLETDPDLEKASETGWRPKEEWDGDPEDWVDYKEYNRRGELMERIKTQSSQLKKFEKELSRTKETLSQLAEHHQKVRETEYKKAMEDLKQMKKEAYEVGDYDTVVDVDEKIEELKEVTKSEKKQPTNKAPEELNDWIEENEWYTNDRVMRGAAEAIAQDLVQEDPDLKGNLAALLKKVKQEVEKEFPHKFKKPSSRASVLEPDEGDVQVRAARSSTKKYTARHLNEEQKKVAKRFVEIGAIKNMDEYAEQLAQQGEL